MIIVQREYLIHSLSLPIIVSVKTDINAAVLITNAVQKTIALFSSPVFEPIN